MIDVVYWVEHNMELTKKKLNVHGESNTKQRTITPLEILKLKREIGLINFYDLTGIFFRDCGGEMNDKNNINCL